MTSSVFLMRTVEEGGGVFLGAGEPAEDPAKATVPMYGSFRAEALVARIWIGDDIRPERVVAPPRALLRRKGEPPAGEKKAIRGGGFNGGMPLWVNPAFRYHQVATASAPAIGFRCE